MTQPHASDATTPEVDTIFAMEYVRHKHEPTAGVIACIKANIRDRDCHISMTADRMLKRPEIKTAIALLEKTYKSAVTEDVSVQTITSNLERLAQRAEEDRQYPAAIAAQKLIAQLHKLLDTNISMTITHKAEEMTTDQLMKIVSKSAPVTINGDFTETPPPVHRGLGSLPSV